LHRALDVLRGVLRRAPAEAAAACSSCGEPCIEGLGDPKIERVCMACAVMLLVQCSDGDTKACERLEALNALARRSERGGAG